MTMQIGIYIFDNVEVLDFAGPYEVFTCASRVNRDETPLFEVFTVGDTLRPVHARAGLKIDPDFSLENHPDIDCLIIPGGVVNAELDKPNVIEWIAKQALTTKITASVCTGHSYWRRPGY